MPSSAKAIAAPGQVEPPATYETDLQSMEQLVRDGLLEPRPAGASTMDQPPLQYIHYVNSYIDALRVRLRALLDNTSPVYAVDHYRYMLSTYQDLATHQENRLMAILTKVVAGRGTTNQCQVVAYVYIQFHYYDHNYRVAFFAEMLPKARRDIVRNFHLQVPGIYDLANSCRQYFHRRQSFLESNLQTHIDDPNKCAHKSWNVRMLRFLRQIDPDVMPREPRRHSRRVSGRSSIETVESAWENKGLFMGNMLDIAPLQEHFTQDLAGQGHTVEAGRSASTDGAQDKAKDKAQDKATGKAKHKAKDKGQDASTDGAQDKAKDKAQDKATGKAKHKAKDKGKDDMDDDSDWTVINPEDADEWVNLRWSPGAEVDDWEDNWK